MATPTQLKQGTGSQIVLGYWTYYDGMAVDPTDDCTFWYGAQFLAATGVYNWNTHLASLKFASCN